jgi:uncharacterized protein (TIGR03118 family)
MVSSEICLSARHWSLVSAAALSFATVLAAQPTQHYTQTNLVSDMPGVAAVTDPNLVNAWGMSRSSGSPWWVSDNGPGLATLYNGAGAIQSLVVTIPGADGGAGTPTGQVFNGTNDFQLTPNNPANGNPAKFIFVTEDGTVSGWNPAVNPTVAQVKVNTHSASVFKGVALATASTASGAMANYLYVADFRKGHVNVYDANFHRAHLDDDAFEDESIPRGFAPFNIQNIGGNLYVAFAQPDSAKHDEVDGAGLGYVDVFSPGGRLLHRLQHGQWFNAPWGMAQAPTDFGANSHNILVGQFGSGQILVFDPVTGKFKGPLYDATNTPIVIDGLWGLAFGSGGTGSGPATTLYFTAGPDGEQHGLFGTITAVENVLGGDL